MRDGSGSQERREESHQADRECLLPFRAEDRRIQFRAGQKRQNDCARACQETDPSRFCAQRHRSNQCANKKPRHSPDDYLGKSSRDPKPNRK
jgi:hypothetical protein